jgi:hypothetical protein
MNCGNTLSTTAESIYNFKFILRCKKRHDQMFKVEFRNDFSKDRLIREKKYTDDAIGWWIPFLSTSSLYPEQDKGSR